MLQGRLSNTVFPALNHALKEYGIQVQRLFGHRVTEYARESHDENRKVVHVSAQSVDDRSTTVVIADNVIKATGFDVPIKEPIIFSAQHLVESTCPVDLLKPDGKLILDPTL